MRSPIPDFLDETLDRFRPDRSGENADHPDLAAAGSGEARDLHLNLAAVSNTLPAVPP